MSMQNLTLPPISPNRRSPTNSKTGLKTKKNAGKVVPASKSPFGLATGIDFSEREGELLFDPEVNLPRRKTITVKFSPKTLKGVPQLGPSPIQAKPDEKSEGKPTTLTKTSVLKSKTTPAITLKEALANKQGRFKSLARMVKANLLWTKESESKADLIDQDRSFTVTNTENGETETLTFNPGNYKVVGKTYGGLAARTRRILMKGSIERTDEEVEILKSIVDRLKCFERYSTKVRQEMARVLEYDSFEDGKIIIKQGHMGVSFYFIVSGSVRVIIRETDKNTGVTLSHCIGELTEGSSFGELALLHNIERTATIMCKGNSEFLRIDKEDFDMVLRMSYEYEYTQRLNGLKQIPVFRGLPDADMASIANNSKTVEYPSGKVIFGNTSGNSESVFFINTGSVSAVRQMILMREDCQGGKRTYHLPEDNGLKSHRKAHRYGRLTLTHNRLEQLHLMKMCTLTRGAYFGVGEDLTDIFLISAERVEIIMVPRVLFAKYGPFKQLEHMRTEWSACLPDCRETFYRYIMDKKWKAYRRSVIDEVISRKRKTNSTRLEDVPLTIRMSDYASRN